MQRERGVGLEMRGRRLDAGHQRGPVGDEDEDEQRADEGAIGRRLDAHRIADLAIDGVDDQFERRLGRRGHERQAAGDDEAAEDQRRHDRPGDDDRLGDRRRTDMEQGEADERRVMTRRLRFCARRRRGRSARRAPSPAAAARLPGSPRSAAAREARRGAIVRDEDGDRAAALAEQARARQIARK